MIISIEGPDFVGKTTIISGLLNHYETLHVNLQVQSINFPNTDTEIGKICRKMLQNTGNWSSSQAAIFQLLNTAHRYEYYDLLLKAKQSRDFLLFVTRYNLSGPVYASIDGLNATHTWHLYEWLKDVLPDITFIIFRQYSFDELSKARYPDHYESEEKQEKIRKIYEIAPILWSDQLGKAITIINQSLESSLQEIIKVLNPILLLK